jgi:hypothetical protein
MEGSRRNANPPVGSMSGLVRSVIVLLAVLAIGGAAAVWVSDGAGGVTSVTTISQPTTVIASTTASGATTISRPGTAVTRTTPGRPARSAESALELFLLGAFLVLIIAAFSKGPVTIGMPGGPSVQVGEAAQAQITGAIAQHYTKPESAQAAYTQATAALRTGGFGRRVTSLTGDQLNQLMSEVGSTVPFEQD